MSITVIASATLLLGMQSVICAPLNAIERDKLPSISSTAVSDHTTDAKVVVLKEDTLPVCNGLQLSRYRTSIITDTNKNININYIQLVIKIFNLFSGKRANKKSLSTIMSTNSKNAFKYVRKADEEKYIGRRCHMAYKTCLGCIPDATGVNNCKVMSIPDHWVCESPVFRKTQIP